MNDNQKTSEPVPFKADEKVLRYCKDFASFVSKQAINDIHTEMVYHDPKPIQLAVMWKRHDSKGGPDGTDYISTVSAFESNGRSYVTAYLSGTPKEND